MGIREATMWRTRIKILLKWIGVGLILVGLGSLILGGYALDWTGFGEHVNVKGEVEREKTLWDWMNLLIVPIVLALGGLWFSRQERKAEREIEKERAQTEREIATDRQREAALQMYFDRMTELLLEKGLGTSKAEPP
jgi:hypothetical protein